MEVGIKETILAIITTDPQKVFGSSPVFIAKDKEEANRIGLLLSRILKAMVHDLENGVYIVVKH